MASMGRFGPCATANASLDKPRGYPILPRGKIYWGVSRPVGVPA